LVLSSFPEPRDISLTHVTDLASLAGRWRALEAVAEGGFFRGWCFVSRQAARFDAPHLLAMTGGGQDLGLALLNRRGGRFYLNETGDAARDAIYVEHNGVLLRPGAEECLAAALGVVCQTGPLVLSGVDAAHRAAARAAGMMVEDKAQSAPAIELDRLEGAYLASLSANTRAQVRRAMRLCGAGLALTRAPDGPAALAWFDEMVDLHTRSWRKRGRPGAFTDPGIVAFHKDLLVAAVPEGQADLLRIATDGAPVGYLYNFVHQGRVYCYQSGFAAAADERMKPGLVSHALAVEHYRAKGMRVYDMLAGPARYKLSLAPSGGPSLYWLTVFSRRDWRGWAAFGRVRARQWGHALVGGATQQLALSWGRAYGRRVSTPAVSPPDD
jgi:CelD/BcsL family acetyltransferase involved in cellulose biosynthesis